MANPSDQGTPRPAGPAVEPFKTGTATPSSTASHPMPSTAPMSSASSPTGSAPERSPAQPFESGRQPRDSGPSIATGLKETAQTATDAVRQQAAQFAQDVGHELNKTGEAQKARGVEAIRRFARAIDNAASELQSQSPVVARSVHEAARRVDGLSDNLANRNVSEFVELGDAAHPVAAGAFHWRFGRRRLCPGAVSQEQRPTRALQNEQQPLRGGGLPQPLRVRRIFRRRGVLRKLGPTAMPIKESTRPLASVMTQVASDLAYLVQTEFRLARAEIGEKLSAASNAGVYLAIGAVFALSGLIALLFDIAQWIAVAGLPYEWALLIVAVAALAIGAALGVAGAGRLKGSALVPNRTLEQVREDYVVAKEHVR